MSMKVEQMIEKILEKDNKNANKHLKEILIQKVKKRILDQIEQE